MNLRKKISLAAGATAAASLVALGLPASPASASVTPYGCGATAATVYNGSNIVYSASCSGDFYYSAQWSTKLVANGWSGAVYDTNNAPHWFCDFQTITLNVYTKGLYLNATKPPRCQ